MHGVRLPAHASRGIEALLRGLKMRFDDPSIYPIEPAPLPASPSVIVSALRAHDTDERYAKILRVAEQCTTSRRSTVQRGAVSDWW